jgi:hypothetical protein
MLSCHEGSVGITCYSVQEVENGRGVEVTTGRTNKTDGRRKPEEIGRKKNVWQRIS